MTACTSGTSNWGRKIFTFYLFYIFALSSSGKTNSNVYFTDQQGGSRQSLTHRLAGPEGEGRNGLHPAKLLLQSKSRAGDAAQFPISLFQASSELFPAASRIISPSIRHLCGWFPLCSPEGESADLPFTPFSHISTLTDLLRRKSGCGSNHKKQVQESVFFVHRSRLPPLFPVTFWEEEPSAWNSSPNR